MSRKPETLFSQRIKDLKKLNKNYYFQAIETYTSCGVADLFAVIKGQSFWLELKVNQAKKSTLNIGLSKYQTAWQTVLNKHGGYCFNLVRVSSQRVVKTYRQEARGLRELSTHPDTQAGLCEALEHMAEFVRVGSDNALFSVHTYTHKDLEP
jgi:penicillin-binding protein-related factor A (putative recombinase)